MPLLEGINSRKSEAEDKMVEITSEKQNKIKRMKRTEDGLRDLWDNIKCNNLRIIGVPEEEAEKAMAPHSSTLAWKIPWMEEPGRLQSMGSLSRTRLSDFTLTFHFHALEKEMATHSSVLAWRIPGMGEPGGLLSMGSHRVGHD